MLAELLEQARRDEALWLSELRAAFSANPTARPMWMRLTLHSGERRDYPCAIPRWANAEERRLAAEYLYACVYNCLSACSGRELCFFFDPEDSELSGLADSLDTVFQLGEKTRHGYGKVISIAGHISRSCGGPPFRFTRAALADYAPLPPQAAPPRPAPLGETLRALGGRAAGLALCGIDVGGTDIKLAAAAGDRLVCTREYDWNPAAYQTAEEITGPILLLTRLMRACLAAERTPLPESLRRPLDAALERDAPLPQVRAAVEAAERRLGAGVELLNGVGLSYPDVVIGDHILGGETPKTDGMRRNTAVDYEEAFSHVSRLREALLALCRPGGQVRVTNDGNMAAFTAAMELAHSGAAGQLAGGVVAHSLGTDLGTGWLTADGTIPALPLELYDMILDLGSYRSRAYAPEDLRSTRNENSGLPGARRYLGQSAAYRLAQRLDARLLEGFTERDGELLRIASGPRDLRKPCLEHLMQCAEAGDDAACAVFRGIGENLAVVTQEMEFLLSTGIGTRFLFGRFVKRPGVFRLLEAGFSARLPEMRLLPSDGELARTPLMRALAASPTLTVAQFGQAVGAIYFALT